MEGQRTVARDKVPAVGVAVGAAEAGRSVREVETTAGFPSRTQCAPHDGIFVAILIVLEVLRGREQMLG